MTPKTFLLLASAIALTWVLGTFLPHQPGSPSFVGIVIGAGASVALIQFFARRDATARGLREPTGMVLLGFTRSDLYKWDAGSRTVTSTPLAAIAEVNCRGKRILGFFSTWRLDVVFADPRPPLRVWISCFSFERRAVRKVQAFAADLQASVLVGHGPLVESKLTPVDRRP